MGTLKGNRVFKGIGWHYTDLAVKIKMSAEVCRVQWSDSELFFLQRCTQKQSRKCKMWLV